MKRYIKGIRDGKNIYFDDIKDVLIPYFPISNWSQKYKKILSIHEDLFKNFANLDKKILLLLEYRKSLISTLISGNAKLKKEIL